MSKRFTDTEKWKKEWFLALSPVQKCFWSYVCDNCSIAGIWDVNFKLAAYMIGADLNEAEIKTVFKKQFQEFDGGKRWFIPSFTVFQYGPLVEACKPHARVIAELKRFGIPEGIHTLKNTVKDKTKQDNNKKKTLFKKPSLEELTDALTAGGLEAASALVEAQKFLDYYETVGWVVGKTQKPMKSWRGAVSTWIQNYREWQKANEKNPMNLNKKQVQNMEALHEFAERAARPQDLRPGDGSTRRSLPGS